MDLAQQAVQTELLSKLKSSNWYDQNLYPALAAVDPTTGELVAFYGGTTQYNWATQGQVQPGSTFKAFTLATAFKQNISPNSYINGNSPWPDPNNPAEMAFAAGDRPVTNDDGSHGMIDINTATAASINTAFVRLSGQLGYNNVMQTVNALGINSKNAQGLTANARLTLGISAVSPARMADAYSAFADNGAQYPLIEVTEIKSSGSGGVDWKTPMKPNQVLDPNVAETVTQTLTHVTHDSDGTGAAAPGESGLNNVAGKTGTSTMELTTLQKQYPDIYSKTQNGHFDTAATWFNGFTTKLETAVSLSRWITEPNPNANQPGQPPTLQIQAPVDNINNAGFSFGADYPLAIWSDFMKLMQGTGSKFAGDTAFPTPNTTSMMVSGSPTPSASASATASAPSNPNTSAPATPTLSPTPSLGPSSSPSCGGLSSIFGNCPSTGPSSSSSPGKGHGGGPSNSPSP
jgi:membrane peptidoglycan carboxypeptidase